MGSSFSHDLDEWLDEVQDHYVVERTLSSSDTEITEVVWKKTKEGEPAIGPFVRKTFTSDDGRGSAYLEILRYQAKGKRLEHQPFVYECERAFGGLQVVMEYVRGENLRDLVTRTGPSPELAAHIMGELCDAASELHDTFEAPIIHRDIKPSNVMVTDDTVKLIDLGIARSWRKDAAHDTQRLGTPGYAPPEQFGYGQTSVRSDVYALGMTCAFCLVGHNVGTELFEADFEDDAIPAPVRKVLARACAFDPDTRHASAQELKEELLAALTGKRDVREKAEAKDWLEMAGKIWNTILGALWSIVLVGSFLGAQKPTGKLAELPTWLLYLEYISILIVPVSVVVYLLLDKRRLRARIPLIENLTWKQELPICLAVVLISLVGCYTIANLTGHM